MLKRTSFVAIAALALLMVAGDAGADETFTGEIVEKACFVDRGAHGEDHASCAKRCIERGGDLALLTAEGDLVILRADGDDAAPFESLKEMIAASATVSGTVIEEDGFKVMTVKTSEAAS